MILTMKQTGLPAALAPKVSPPSQPQAPGPRAHRAKQGSARPRRTTLLTVAALSVAALLAGCTPAAEDQAETPSAAPTASSAPPKASSQPAGGSPSAPTPSRTKDPVSPVPEPLPSTTAPGTPSADQDEPTAGGPGAGDSTGKKRPKTLPANNLQVVVNKHTPLSPLDYAPTDLVNVGNGQQLRAAAASAYQQLVNGASAAGYALLPSSGYRSYATQVQTHNHWRNQYGAEYAERISARPGYSEHQTGLAIDVMPSSGQCRLEVCFGTLPEGKWVAANAHKYGFIIRYPQGQEAVTGYSYEPWHLRYVGVEAATSIKSAGQTMEAFYGHPAAPNYR